MRARHGALVRDVMDIHAGGFSAVCGCRKVWHELIGKGWDPGEVGRDQVMNIMRGLGIRGVRRGKTPVTAKPVKGAGGGPGLVDREFEAEAPNRLHVAGIAYVHMADGRFAYTAFVTDVFAGRIVGRACAATMNAEELPRRRWSGRSRGPRRMAGPTVSSATAIMACSASARCTPPG